MGGTRFMVQWEEHPSHLATRLGQLLEHQTLVDVTLMCNTHTLRVHRAVLAACSPYFETILQRQLGMYPLIVLKDMQFSVLKSLIEFMYCGETSVTEDNLSALLQAAKFFQVKGLSAMTKEALGLTSPATPKTTTTVNGEAARKAFVGRSKRVGMQQTFVASGLKSVTASSSHVHGAGSDVHAPTTGKTIFQTTPKSVPVRQDTHQQQQQTDTAQLLLSLSGSEFPKQTFHTVSKNVRFHHGASSGNVTVEPSRTCSLESSVVKNKEPTIRSEVIDRVPVVTSDSGMKSTSVVLPTQLVEKGLDQQIIPEKTVEGTKDDVTSQMFYVEDGPCKRGRPLKRQMNLVFQEKVLTDAEMALQKEAEASRKALEMLQQEMSTGDETPSTVVTQPAESVQQKNVPVKQSVTKAQPTQVNNMITTSRILSKDSTVASKLGSQKTNIVTQATAVSTSETSSQNVIYQVSGNTIPAIDSNSNETNIVYQLQEGQNSGNTNIVYQVADSAVLAGQDSNNQNIIYQVAENAGTSTVGSNNTNIIYQVTDTNTGSSTTMSQYMEVLKEAGLPSDVPILLESSDGSYVTVNEEVLMNIMNGGMIQVSDGSIVGGEGVQFIVQEVQEMNEGQIENAAVCTEQEITPDVATSATTVTESNSTVTETVSMPTQEMQISEGEKNLHSKPPVTTASISTVKHSTYKPAKGQQSKANAAKSLLPLVVKEDAEATPGRSNVASINESLMKSDPKEAVSLTENVQLEINETRLPPIPEPPTQSDEIITGDNYGEEAMEGFAVVESKENAQNIKMELTQSDTSDFAYPEHNSSNEADEKSFPPNTEPVKELKAEDAPASGNMSVEQALQAMMGEGSDTEMEVCANTDADGTTKVKPIISHRDTKDHSTPNEGSIDEETEDLRLVLSPEDDSIKVEDESQSAGEGSLNDSFTLALSSPDSTGNEKNNMDADNVTESAEDSQQLEMKPVQAVIKPVGLTEAKTVEAIIEKEVKYPEAILTCESNSTAATSCNEISESVSGEISTDSNSLESIKQATVVIEEQFDRKSLLRATESDNTYSQKVEGSGTGGALIDTSFVSEESANIQTEHEDVTEEKHSDTEEPTEPIVTVNPVIESNNDKGLLSESGVEFQVDAACSNDPENTKFESDLPTYESNIEVENDTVNFADNSDTATKVIPEEELKTEMENCAVSKLSHNELVDVVEETSSSLSDAARNDNEKDILRNINSECVPALNETNIKELAENEEMRTTGEVSDKQIENQGNEQLEASNPIADEVDVGSKGGVVTSPSKDIPYAVGLLPLKTALEKLQAMPEYQPRKTRSSSSSKELTSEVPASRLKRKSSSAAEGSEKKLKSDDGDCGLENENIIAVATEELEEYGEENMTLESCGMETPINNVTMESSVPEEPMHTEEVENTVEPLPSVMELVSESSGTV